MRTAAIFISPFFGHLFAISITAFISSNTINLYWELLFIGYFIALFTQGIIEIVLFFIKRWLVINLETYLSLACIICFWIWVFSFGFDYKRNTLNRNLINSFEVFIFFFGYSIINALTYNYLYFSKIEE